MYCQNSSVSLLYANNYESQADRQVVHCTLAIFYLFCYETIEETISDEN